MASINEVAAQIMEHLCTHSSHGYTQGNRWGDGGTETITIDGKNYTIATGDRDCSSAVCNAYQTALKGTVHEGKLNGATYTGNMRSIFVNSGLFEWKPMSFSAQRGDIYLNERNHTAMCTHPYGSSQGDILAEFCISENGTIYGNVGDQTGRESYIHNYYDYPWNGILHWIGSGEAKGDGSSVSAPSKPAASTSTGNGDVRYRAYVDGQWLPEMVNHKDTGGSSDTYAGILGKPITYLTINMNGQNGWYQVKSQGGGWLDPVRGYSTTDFVYGAAGDGTPITGVRCYYETPEPNVTGWKVVEYQVHLLGSGWLPLMHDLTDTGGSADDFAGDLTTPIDGFRAKIVNQF